MARAKKEVINVSLRSATKAALMHAAEVYEDSMSGIVAKLLDDVMSSDVLRKQFYPLLDTSAPNKPAMVVPKELNPPTKPAELPDMIDLPGGFTYYPNTRQCRHDVTNDGWMDITLEQAKELVAADIQENGVYND